MVPVSRKERLRQRALARARESPAKAETAPAPPPKRLKREAMAQEVEAPVPESQEEEEEVLEPTEGPSEADEMSASAFLAAVKGRLLEWGQVEHYHRFVVSLSGTVDVPLALKILRGHDDLIQVFRRKFAPQQDLEQSKKEIQEQEEQEAEGPRPPPFPPPGEDDMVQPVGLTGGDEDLPKPPVFPPGHESDEEEHLNEASVAAAIEGGPQECVRQLVQLLFDRSAESHHRLSVSGYALKVASKPRFPRELYILRGVPGIGKSDFAMEKLSQLRRLELSEELPARLSHVCAVEDFLSYAYRGEEHQLHKAMQNNELRALLTMEAGIHPVFIDCPNLRLWEMKPYVLLAERLGYVIHVVEPWEICAKSDDLPFLCSLHDASVRQQHLALTRQQLQRMLQSFQPLPDPAEPAEAIRRASSRGARHFVR